MTSVSFYLSYFNPKNDITKRVKWQEEDLPLEIISPQESDLAYVDIEFALDIIEDLNNKSAKQISKEFLEKLKIYFADQEVSMAKEKGVTNFAQNVLYLAQDLYGYPEQISNIWEELFHSSMQEEKSK